MEIKEASRKQLGKDFIKSCGLFGKKRDFYYSVPPKTIHVGFDTIDESSNSWNIGNGNGKATLHWTKGSGQAKVHAWVNGKFGGRNRIDWVVYAFGHY